MAGNSPKATQTVSCGARTGSRQSGSRAAAGRFVLVLENGVAITHRQTQPLGGRNELDLT